ncbi:hypothetical protein HYH03_018568 [Edaphochlamys debaryana]|uniref:Uncharacterized protein n=1 Tax=Edaphochlamys debaryana TaxID=47281 RepID=A0A835XEC8_9CHLO|nr:hypothetical protein HYH03_018568 [Edaphochlamys debaryana]|eukprot:KAG2482493.1 hypothetical protein HYH03_018568 [Edaphochlamys debaryana]
MDYPSLEYWGSSDKEVDSPVLSPHPAAAINADNTNGPCELTAPPVAPSAPPPVAEPQMEALAHVEPATPDKSMAPSVFHTTLATRASSAPGWGMSRSALIGTPGRRTAQAPVARRTPRFVPPSGHMDTPRPQSPNREIAAPAPQEPMLRPAQITTIDQLAACVARVLDLNKEPPSAIESLNPRSPPPRITPSAAPADINTPDLAASSSSDDSDSEDGLGGYESDELGDRVKPVSGFAPLSAFAAPLFRTSSSSSIEDPDMPPLVSGSDDESEAKPESSGRRVIAPSAVATLTHAVREATNDAPRRSSHAEASTSSAPPPRERCAEGEEGAAGLSGLLPWRYSFTEYVYTGRQPIRNGGPCFWFNISNSTITQDFRVCSSLLMALPALIEELRLYLDTSSDTSNLFWWLYDSSRHGGTPVSWFLDFVRSFFGGNALDRVQQFTWLCGYTGHVNWEAHAPANVEPEDVMALGSEEGSRAIIGTVNALGSMLAAAEAAGERQQEDYCMQISAAEALAAELREELAAALQQAADSQEHLAAVQAANVALQADIADLQGQVSDLTDQLQQARAQQSDPIAVFEMWLTLFGFDPFEL